jgi:hypothetical protein
MTYRIPGDSMIPFILGLIHKNSHFLTVVIEHPDTHMG